MAKTREAVDLLKENWRADPCYDLASVDGFDEHQQELSSYQVQMETYWQAQFEKRRTERMTRMGLDNTRSDHLALYKHLNSLELRIASLERKQEEAEAERNGF